MIKIKIKYTIISIGFLAISFLFITPITKAGATEIDCNAGSPRNIAQGTDFSSGDDLTLSGVGTCVLTNAATLTSLTIGNGSTATVLTHTNNTTTQANLLDITTTGNINVTLNASINVDGKGFDGQLSGDGYGPAKGLYSNNKGGGGGHGGNGGAGNDGGATGGIANCSISDPATIGSSGGAYDHTAGGGAGGGLIILNAGGTVTILGTITADGVDTVNDAGGGGGGGIKITGNIINGPPQSFTVTGGNGGWGAAGNGGGGCALLTYTASISNIDATANAFIMNGGTGGYVKGGAGQILIKDSDSGDGDLYILGTGTLGASTPLLSSPLTIDTITINDDAILNIANGDVLNIEDGNSVLSPNNDGVINIYGTLNASTGTIDTLDNAIFNLYSGGALENGAALSIAADATVNIYSGSTVTNSTLTSLTTSGTVLIPSGIFTSLGALTINAGTVTMDNYSTSTAQTVTNIVVNGGTLTHSDNSTTQAHVLNITASGDITIGASGTVSADGLGYDGQGNNMGLGAGPGLYADNKGGGGGYGGAGGAGDHVGATGGAAVADCENNPNIIGSSGGAYDFNNAGGSGGGLIILTASSGTVTVSGTVTADGANGPEDAGGGSGGGIKITSDILAGDPSSFTATGGNTLGGFANGGGGGGGCVYVGYSTSIADTINDIGDITLTGGTGNVAGGIGTFLALQLNTAPTASAISPVQSDVDTVTVTSTIADADSDVTSLTVEYSTDNSNWNNATIATATADQGEIVIAGAGSLTGIDTNLDGSVDVTLAWSVSTDLADTIDSTVYFRITPHDGTVSGSTATSSAFAINTNSAPTASAIAPSQTSLTTVALTSTIADIDSEATTLTVEYSTDNSNWNNATIATATADQGEIVIAGAGSLTGIDTNLDGSVDISLVWNAGFDLPTTNDSTVYFRITPHDGTIAGTAATSSAFALITFSGSGNTAKKYLPTIPAPKILNKTESTLDLSITNVKTHSPLEYSIQEIISGKYLQISLEYSIQEVNSGKYLQTNSTLGTAQAWQSPDLWGNNIQVKDLFPDQDCVFNIMARIEGGTNYIESPESINLVPEEEQVVEPQEEEQIPIEEPEPEESQPPEELQEELEEPQIPLSLSDVYKKIIAATEIDKELEGKWLSHYQIQYQLKCLAENTEQNGALCFNAKINLIYAQTVTNTIKIDIQFSERERYLIKLRSKWPEKRYFTGCVESSGSPDRCLSLKESLKKIYYFVGY